MRAFLAVPLSPALAETVLGWQAELAAAGLRARFTPRHQLHLTLRFFADIPEPAAEAILAELAARPHPAFRLSLEGAGAFPSEARPRVLWIGVAEGRRELGAMAADAEKAARALGLPPEPRPFRPHLTVARLSGAGPAGLTPWQAARGRAWGSQVVQEIMLFRSTLSAAGANHEPFGRVRLGSR